VSFRSDGTYDPEGKALAYKWEFGDGNSSTDANPQHIYTQAGTFAAKLTVSEVDDPANITTSTISIRTGVTPPKVFIDSPPPDTLYAVGDLINLSGRAEGAGNISLMWSVLQRHNQHDHLVAEISSGSGSFEAEEHSDDSSYQVCLSARDEADVTDQKCVFIKPRATEYTFASSPVGAPITYVDESRDVLAPYVAKPVVNSHQTIVAAAEYLGRTFVQWSDGVKARERSFVVGTEPQVMTALYGNQAPLIGFKQPRVGKRLPVRVKFDAGASSDPEGGPLKYSWRFSDGTKIAGPVISKSFTKRGRYRVTLTVSDKLGEKTTESFVIQVGHPQTELHISRPRIQLRGAQSIVCGTMDAPCVFGDDVDSVLIDGSNLPKAAPRRKVVLVTEKQDAGSWSSIARRSLRVSSKMKGRVQIPLSRVLTKGRIRMSIVVEDRGRIVAQSSYLYFQGE
jgi:PKD repeat protein